MQKMKGISNTAAILAVILAFVVAGGGVWYVTSGGLPLQQAVGGGGIITQPTTPTTAPTITLDNCPDTKTGTLNVRYQNPLNSSNSDFPPAVVRLYGTGQFLNSITTLNTGSYQTQSVNCPTSGAFFVIGDSTSNSINGEWVLNEANEYETVQGSRTSTLVFRILNSLQNNISAGDVDSFNASNAVTTSNQAIAAGDTKDYYIDFKPTTAYTQYGDHINGQLICTRASLAVYDLIELKDKNGVNKPEFAVPSAVSGTDTKCWKDTAVKTTEGYRTLWLHVHANTEPGTANDLGLDFYDFQNYVGLDGKTVKNNIRNDANSDVGAADGYAEVSVS